MLLALFSATVALLIAVPIFMFFYSVFRRSFQPLLCTECQQCKSGCSLSGGGFGPTDIMKAAKVGAPLEQAEDSCTGCKACERLCSRGLAPYLELRPTARRIEKKQRAEL